MSVAEYLVVTSIAFQLPVHPRPGLVHISAPNAATQQETICTCKAMLKELAIATTAKEELKKQLLEAVNCLYLAALNDDMFGFSEVSIADMVVHLHTTYVPITHSELESNCASIATMWTPKDPIKTLWESLCKVQCISIAGSNLLTDGAIKDLTLIMFETTGMFTTACDRWQVKPVANQMLIEFHQHFTDENKECLCKLMAAQLGYHGANHVMELTQLILMDTLIEHSTNAAIST